MTTAFQELTPDSCIQTMQAFWSERVEAAYTRDGIALTLPLMYPDGWQVTAYITTTVRCHARLYNNGKTLGSLIEAGMKLDARLTASFLAERLKMFEVQQDGFILTKNVQLPLQGVDVQIFAEAPRATGRRGCSRPQAPEVATETLSLAEIFVTRGVSASGSFLSRGIRCGG